MEEDILTILDDYKQLSVVEIADMMDAHPVAVDRHCYQLHQDGYLRVFNSGLYQLTADGADLSYTAPQRTSWVNLRQHNRTSPSEAQPLHTV